MDIYESFKKNFDRNNCLLRLSEEMKNLFVESSVEDSSKAVLCFLFSQLRNTCKSIEILCRHGYSEQAYVLLRSLQEGYLHISYILQKEETVVTRAREWIEYDVIERKKMLYWVERNEGMNPEVRSRWLNEKDEILSSYEKIRKKKGLWVEKPLSSLCDELGLQDQYLLYKRYSSKGHLSPRATLEQVTLDGDTISYKWGPRKEEAIIEVLDSSHGYYLLILMLLFLHFQVEPTQKLHWHIKLWRNLPNHIKGLWDSRYGKKG